MILLLLWTEVHSQSENCHWLLEQQLPYLSTIQTSYTVDVSAHNNKKYHMQKNATTLLTPYFPLVSSLPNFSWDLGISSALSEKPITKGSTSKHLYYRSPIHIFPPSPRWDTEKYGMNWWNSERMDTRRMEQNFKNKYAHSTHATLLRQDRWEVRHCKLRILVARDLLIIVHVNISCQAFRLTM